VLIVGGTVLAGVMMIIAPGPAFVVIPLGLAVLGLESAWARYCLRRLRVAISGQGQRIALGGRTASAGFDLACIDPTRSAEVLVRKRGAMRAE